MNAAAGKGAPAWLRRRLALLSGMAAAWAQAAAPDPAAPGPAAPFRFSVRAETLSLSQCVAEPGHVPLALAPNSPSLEIVDWDTASGGEPHLGEFLVRFAAPTPVGTVVAYEPGEVSFSASNTWHLLPPRLDQGRALQVLPLPPATPVEAIRFRVPARAVQPPNQPPLFQARLPFATFLPVRAINLAPVGRADASSSAAGLDPAMLIDGKIDPHANFSTALRRSPNGTEAPDWLTLSWETAQPFRGMMLFRGAADAGIAEPRVDFFTGEGDPSSAQGLAGWKPVAVRSTAPGRFRSNQFLVLVQPAESRAVRLSTTGGVSRIQLGEWAVLRLLGTAPAPDAPARSVTPEWMVSRVAPGRIRIDGRDDDWPAGRTNGFALAWDDQHLYLLYQARGAAARFGNPGTNLQTLFYSGDALDLQFRPGPIADGVPSPGSAGERRVILSLWNGKPVVVLYEARTEDLLLVPTVFKSPSRTVSFDRVGMMPDAKMELRRGEGELTVEASFPLAACGLFSGRVRELRGDVGRILGDAGRAYWASPATNAPADVAEAAELHPQAWGVFRFEYPPR